MFGFFKRRESRRIDELLAANNAYLQRAREAEGECDALRAANAEMCADLDARDFVVDALHSTVAQRDGQLAKANATINTLTEVFEVKDRMISDLAMSVAILKSNNEAISRDAVRQMYLYNRVAARLSDSRKKCQAVENRLWLQEEVNRNLSKELGDRPAKPSGAAASALGMRKPGPWDLGDGFDMREAA